MARFRGTVRGGRGEASRLGHRHITTTANGWDLGVNVDGDQVRRLDDDQVTYDDHFAVYATGGSSGSSRSHKIATVEEVDGAEYIGGPPARMRRITLFDREGNVLMEYTV